LVDILLPFINRLLKGIRRMTDKPAPIGWVPYFTQARPPGEAFKATSESSVRRLEQVQELKKLSGHVDTAMMPCWSWFR